MGKIVDLTGQRFGRLVVRGRSKKDDGRRGAYWECECDCGSHATVYMGSLRGGRTKSCGCLGRERASYSARNRTKHGMTRTSEHMSWVAMKSRCNNSRHKQYKNYGGRGVKVCKRWQDSFQNFLKDMGPRPSPSHSIDRIDNDGDYAPENCRWATMKEQNRNKRDNITLEFEGHTGTLAEWSELTGISRGTIASRLRMGWSTKDVLTKLSRGKR